MKRTIMLLRIEFCCGEHVVISHISTNTKCVKFRSILNFGSLYCRPQSSSCAPLSPQPTAFERVLASRRTYDPPPLESSSFVAKNTIGNTKFPDALRRGSEKGCTEHCIPVYWGKHAARSDAEGKITGFAFFSANFSVQIILLKTGC